MVRKSGSQVLPNDAGSAAHPASRLNPTRAISANHHILGGILGVAGPRGVPSEGAMVVTVTFTFCEPEPLKVTEEGDTVQVPNHDPVGQLNVTG